MSEFDDEMIVLANELVSEFGTLSTLRKQTNSGNAAAPTKANIDADVNSVAEDIFSRRSTGKMINPKNMVIIVSMAAGVVPEDKDKIAFGVLAADVTSATPFATIIEAKPVAPSGVNIVFELEVEGFGT